MKERWYKGKMKKTIEKIKDWKIRIGEEEEKKHSHKWIIGNYKGKDDD